MDIRPDHYVHYRYTGSDGTTFVADNIPDLCIDAAEQGASEADIVRVARRPDGSDGAESVIGRVTLLSVLIA